ncbi:MAG: hypothetical protein EBX39_05640 [Actinobacteria bacterium]|nr:hypothetical protein [Actinomycetota bacterium]
MPSIEPTPNGDWSPALPGLGRLSLRWVLLARPRRLRVLASISAFLMLFIIVDTAAFSAPAHGILLDHWDQRTYDGLMRANLIRAWLWTAKGIVAIVMMVEVLRSPARKVSAPD